MDLKSPISVMHLGKHKCITDKRIIGSIACCSLIEISKLLRVSRSSWILVANLGPPKSEMPFKALLGLPATMITETTDGPTSAWILQGRGH